MGKIIAVFNQKGGVGKTATINNLAFELQDREKKVLVVDADQQENLSVSLGVMPRTVEGNTIYDLLRKEIYDEPYDKDLGDTIIHTEYGLDLIPGSVQMAVMDKMLFSITSFPTPAKKFLSDYAANRNNMEEIAKEKELTESIEGFAMALKAYEEYESEFLNTMYSNGVMKKKNGNFVIKEILAPIRDNYDYILIDCPPALSAITVNILSAADRLLIPMSPEPFAASGLMHLYLNVNTLQEQVNPKLKISGLLYTMVEKNRRLAEDLISEATAHYGQFMYIYKAMIPRSTDVNKAFAEQKPLLKYNKNNSARIAYSEFCDEFLRREEKK